MMAMVRAGGGEQPRYRARPGACGALHAQVRSGLHGVDTGAPREIAEIEIAEREIRRERSRREKSPR